MSVRQFYIGRALDSYRSLQEVLNELTEEEIFAALNLETASRRRPSITDRLISRAVRINEIRYARQLKEKFHGTPQEDHDR